MAINPVTGTQQRIQRGHTKVGAVTSPDPRDVGGFSNELQRGVRRGVTEVASLGQEAVAAGQAALGFEDAARENLEAAEQRRQEIAPSSTPRVGRIEDIRTGEGTEAFLADATDYLAQLVGSQAPVIGALGVAGGLGSATARVAGARAATGAVAGVGAGSTAVETGSIFGGVARDPEASGTLQEQALVSGAGGAVAGSLDALPIFQATRRLGVADPLGRSLLHRAARAAVPQATTEALTEGAQTIVERGTHHFLNRNFEVLGPEGASEILNAMAAGAILGGGMGAISGALQQSGPTDNDLIDEVQTEEALNKALLDHRIAGMRGQVDDAILDRFQALPVVDEDILNELDAYTPAEVVAARSLERQEFFRTHGEREPFQALALIKDGLDEGDTDAGDYVVGLDIVNDVMDKVLSGERAELNRREASFAMQFLREGLQSEDTEINDAAATVLGKLEGIGEANLIRSGEATEQEILELRDKFDVENLGRPQGGEVEQDIRNVRERLRSQGQLTPALEETLARAEQELRTSQEVGGSSLRASEGVEDFFASSGLFEGGEGGAEAGDVSGSSSVSGIRIPKQREALLMSESTGSFFVSPERNPDVATPEENIEKLRKKFPEDEFRTIPARLFMEQQLKRAEASPRFIAAKREFEDYLGELRAESGDNQFEAQKAFAERLRDDIAFRESIRERLPQLEGARQEQVAEVLQLAEQADIRSVDLDPNSRVPQEQAFLPRAQAEARIRKTELNPEDPLSVFDGLYAIQRIQPPTSVSNTRANELGLTEDDVSGKIPSNVVAERAFQKKGQGREPAPAQVALLFSRMVRPPVRGKDNKVRVRRDDDNRPKEFIIGVDGEAMAVSASYLTKVMARKLRKLRGQKSEGDLDYTVQEIVEAFSAGVSSLLNIPLASGGGFVDVALPPRLSRDLVVMTSKTGPSVTFGEVMDKFTDGASRDLVSWRAFQDTLSSLTDAAPENEVVGYDGLQLSPADSLGEKAFQQIEFIDEALESERITVGNTTRKLSSQELSVLRDQRRALEEGQVAQARSLGSRARFTHDFASVAALLDIQGSGNSNRPVADASEPSFEEMMSGATFAAFDPDARTPGQRGAQAAREGTVEQAAQPGFKPGTGDTLPSTTSVDAEGALRDLPTDVGIELAEQQILDRILAHDQDALTTEHEAVSQLAAKWARKMGLKGHRQLTTTSVMNILARRRDLTRLQEIADGNLLGLTIGESIWVSPFVSVEAQKELLAHEMGHAVAHSTQPKNDGPVFNAWKKWREEVKQRGDTPAEARRTMKLALENTGNNTARTMEDLSQQDLEYVLDFEEWFADQAADWLISEAKPATSVDRWMKRFVGKLDTLFSDAKAEGAVSDETVAHFLERTIHNNAHASGVVRWWGMHDARSVEPDDVNAALSRTGAALVVDDPTSHYANQAVQMMFNQGWLTGDPARALAQTFTGDTAITRQIQDLLRPHSRAEAEAVGKDWRKAAAYGFQFWSAGNIKLGPKSQNAFERFRDWLLRFVGEVGDFQRTREILPQVAAAVKELQEANSDSPFLAAKELKGEGQQSSFVVSKALKETRLQMIAQANKEIWGKYFSEFASKIFLPAYDRIENIGIAPLTEIARRFHTPPGTEGRGEGYLQARSARIGSWQDQLARAIGEDASPELLSDALEALQQSVPLKDIKDPEVEEIVRNIRATFREMRDYAERGGVRLGNIKDYFPWVYDPQVLAERKDEFIALLLEPQYSEVMEQYLDDLRASGSVRTFVTVEDVAELLHEQLTSDEGYADTGGIRVDRAGHVPFMAAMHSRGLQFLQTMGTPESIEKHASFFSKDLNQTLRVYSEQLVKRVEFTKRFGQPDETTGRTEIDRLMSEARELGATHEDLQLVQDFVDAMQGTLGTRTNSLVTRAFTGEDARPGEVINPKLQTAFSSIILWQNMRVLALATFTSLADPVGILVRGGSLDVALASLEGGFGSSHANKVAQALGIIDTYTIDQALSSTYGTNFMVGRTRLWNERFFHWIGLSTLTRVTRGMATGGAMEFMMLHAERNNATSRRFLAELGLESGADVVQTEDGQVKLLTRAEIDELYEAGTAEARAELARDQRVREGIRRFVDEAILRPNAATRPVWASDPHFQLIFHLKSFMFTFHSIILKRVWREGLKGNYAPMLFLTVFVPVMIAADWLRDISRFGTDGDPAKATWGSYDWITHGIQRSGIPGLGNLLLDAGKDRTFGGIGLESFLGPTAGSLRQVDDILLNENGGRWDAIVDQLPGQNTGVVNEFLR